MQPSICMLISRAPYGAVAAAEGVRHVNGALTEGFAVTIALVDDGVWLARTGQKSGQSADQSAGKSGFVSLSGALAASLHPASGPAPQLVVHRPSLEQRGLAPADLIPGVELVDDAGLAEIIASTRFLLRF